jgi:hypothetical protein
MDVACEEERFDARKKREAEPGASQVPPARCAAWMPAVRSAAPRYGPTNFTSSK